jgi:FdhE protein
MKRQAPVELPEGYLDFYKYLETWQNEQQIKLKKNYQPVVDDAVKIISTTNKPVMHSIDFPLTPGQYQELYQSLIELVRNHRPETAGVMDKIMNQLDKLDFNLLPVKLMEEDQDYFTVLAAELDVPAELLIFTVDHALRPFLRTWAHPYHTALLEAGINTWDLATICPFCGSKPYFSRISSSDGRRYMFCERCFTEWETRNLYCVHCSNNNPHLIQYLTVEDDPGYQVCVCEECKGYIKIFDERQKGLKTDLFIANIETVYLDMLAKEKGYTNHDND